MSTDPRTCAGCVLTRWVRVLSAVATGGYRLVETVISDSHPHLHDCRDNVSDGWQHRSLLPSIDRHGWINPADTIGHRSISTRLRRALPGPETRQMARRMTRPHPSAMGSKGLPDSVNAVFPLAIVETCIIHLIRGTFRYASKRYWEAIAKDLCQGPLSSAQRRS